MNKEQIREILLKHLPPTQCPFKIKKQEAMIERISNDLLALDNKELTPIVPPERTYTIK